MLKNINFVTIIITLEGSKDKNLNKMTEKKKTDQLRERTSGLNLYYRPINTPK